jgi:hypothetical protein
MKLLRVLFFISVPLVFLILGFRAGLSKNLTADSGLASTQSQNGRNTVLSANEKQQLNLLYLTVTDRSENGSLQSAWLVSHHISNPDVVNFVPLFPLEKAGSDELNGLIEDNFSIAASGELSPFFVETLQSLYMLKWDAYLILEPQEIEQAVNLIGESQESASRIANAQLSLKLGDHSLGTKNQTERAATIQQICAQIVQTTESTDLQTFADYIIAHLIIPNRDSGISSDIIRYLIMNPQLSCVFPTLQ